MKKRVKNSVSHLKIAFIFLFFCIKTTLFAQFTLPNHSFEDWYMYYGKELPVGYTTFDEVIARWNVPRPYCTSRSTDTHSGTSALRIDMNTDSAYTYAFMRTAFTGNELPTVFRGWVKGVVFGDDTLTVYAVFSHWNAAQQRRETVGAVGFEHQGPTAQFVEYIGEYYQIEQTMPDTVSVYINFNTPVQPHSATVGNWAILDDFTFDYLSASDGNATNFPKTGRAFPNPTSKYIQIFNAAPSLFTLTDIFGIPLKTGQLPEGAPNINVEDLPSGVYILSIKDEANRPLSSQKILVSH